MSAAPSPQRVAYLLADTPIPDDPRVRRVGDLLHAAGWQVTGIGLGPWRSPAPAWRILTPPGATPPDAAQTPTRPPEQPLPGSAGTPAPVAPPAAPGLLLASGSVGREALKAVWRLLARSMALALAPAPVLVRALSRSAGDALERARCSLRDDVGWLVRQFHRVRSGCVILAFWARRAPVWARLHLGQGDRVEDDFLYRASPHLRELEAIALAQTTPGLWIANDWRMLPIAAAAAARVGGRYVYDSHEFAVEEYGERLSWRLFQRPIAAAVERRFIGAAGAVVSVSPGITQALQKRYALAAPAITVRNTPVYQTTTFRPTGPQIRVLYHGVVSPGRGLEAAIRAAPLLRREFSISIRGPTGLSGYRESLQELITDLGVGERVRLLPPVAMTRLVEEASAFDIGLMALPGHSAHNQFALPNKIFEYMMAGLALCVSDLPSMSEVIDATGAGLRIRAVTPAAIADALNVLDATRIDTMKKAALEAAHIYNWGVEGSRLMAVLNQTQDKAA